MPRGDEKGLDPIPGPNDHADRPIFGNQGHNASLLHGQFPVDSGQTAFGTTDGRQIEKKTEMSGDSHGTGMGNALSVTQD